MSSQKNTVAMIILIVVVFLGFIAGKYFQSGANADPIPNGNFIEEVSENRKETKKTKERDGLALQVSSGAVNSVTENKARSHNFTFDGGYGLKISE